MEDIDHQIKYLRTRLLELVALCEKEATNEVSADVRNIAQDIITRLNRLLDNIAYYIFEKYVKPQLLIDRASLYERQVQFPVCLQPSDLKEQLKRFGAGDLEITKPDVFNILDSVQPYHASNEWLSYIRKYSNLGHRKLIAQSKKKDAGLILGGALRISEGAKVVLQNVMVNGIRIGHLAIDQGRATGDIDPRLNPRVEIRVSYHLEGGDVDLWTLCQQSLHGIQQLVDQVRKVQ